MATFTGTAGADTAEIAPGPTITIIGFTGGGEPELTDAVGDTFLGGEGADVVSAGGGDDIITGGLGDDTLRGNGGADSFVYNAPGEVGKDVIDGGAGVDDVQVGGKIADFTEATIFSFGTASVDRLILFNSIDHQVRFLAAQVGDTGVSKTLFIQGDGGPPDSVTFDAAADLDLSGFTFNLWNEAVDRIRINGTEAGDIIVGTSVADTIAGFDAGDDLRGGAGDDTLDGGGGFDTLVGGAGADALNGGEGNDLFRYFSNAEIDADVINGGADFDFLSINFTGLADFTAATIASGPTPSIERLELVGAGHDVRFNASQVSATGDSPPIS